MGSLKETGKESQPAEKNDRFHVDCVQLCSCQRETEVKLVTMTVLCARGSFVHRKKKYLKLFEFEIRGFLVAWEICLHCRRPVRICPPGSIPELGRSLRRGIGNLLQYSCLHGQSSLVGYSKETWLSEFEINMNLLKSKICNIIFLNPLN